MKDPDESSTFSTIVNYVANTKWFKYFRLPKSTARGLWIHCAQEMQCLKEFLPHFYSQSVDKTDALRRKLWSTSEDQNSFPGISLDSDTEI